MIRSRLISGHGPKGRIRGITSVFRHETILEPENLQTESVKFSPSLAIALYSLLSSSGVSGEESEGVEERSKEERMTWSAIEEDHQSELKNYDKTLSGMSER